MKHIEELWLSYKDEVLPPGTSEVQISETRNAFYAGAGSLFKVIIERAGDEGTPDEVGCKVMDELKEEIAGFLEEKVRELKQCLKPKDNDRN